ncbi:hypothetical protein LINPERHAP1_LOCUS21049, partial [Linum perenne]
SNPSNSHHQDHQQFHHQFPTLVQFQPQSTYHNPNQLHKSTMRFQSIKPSPNSSSQFHVPIPLSNSIHQFHHTIPQHSYITELHSTIPLNQFHISNSCYNSTLNHNRQR